MGRIGGLKDRQKMIAPMYVFAEPAIVLQINYVHFRLMFSIKLIQIHKDNVSKIYIKIINH